MKFVYLRFDKTIFGSSDNLLSSFSDKEGAFEYWGQLKRLCFSHLKTCREKGHFSLNTAEEVWMVRIAYSGSPTVWYNCRVNTSHEPCRANHAGINALRNISFFISFWLIYISKALSVRWLVGKKQLCVKEPGDTCLRYFPFPSSTTSCLQAWSFP